MERSEVLEVFRERAAEVLRVDAGELREDASFDGDLRADSLAVVELTLDMEERLGVELSEEELTGATTVGAYVDVLLRKATARG